MQIAIIPARGGSKRIPHKNIRLFHGKPLIAYAIEACLQSGLFTHILVSTDSADIAAVAQRYGAQTPFVRPAHLAGDMAGTREVVDHALEWAKLHWGKCDYYCQLYANPFVKAENLQQALLQLKTVKADTVFAVTEFPYPVQRALRLNVQGMTEYAFPEFAGSRSQDLPTLYHDAGQFYWHKHTPASPAALNQRQSSPFVLPRSQVVDMDTEEDWRIAEMLFPHIPQKTQQ